MFGAERRVKKRADYNGAWRLEYFLLQCTVYSTVRLFVRLFVPYVCLLLCLCGTILFFSFLFFSKGLRPLPLQVHRTFFLYLSIV